MEVDKIEDAVHFVVVAILVYFVIALPLHVVLPLADWTVLDVSQTFDHNLVRIVGDDVEPVFDVHL